MEKEPKKIETLIKDYINCVSLIGMTEYNSIQAITFKKEILSTIEERLPTALLLVNENEVLFFDTLKNDYENDILVDIVNKKYTLQGPQGATFSIGDIHNGKELLRGKLILASYLLANINDVEHFLNSFVLKVV